MIRINALSFAKMVALLASDACTVAEVAEETGLHEKTCARYMRALHRERLIHVTAWETDAFGRDRAPVYAWGKGKDKPKRRQSNSERAKLYRTRLHLRQMGGWPMNLTPLTV